MPTSHLRIQVTVDPELAEALARAPHQRGSKSRLIRDLALRGARAVAEDSDRQAEAAAYLRGIADGAVDYDFEGLREIHAERERSL